MTKKKKIILIIISAIVVLIAGALIFLYNFEAVWGGIEPDYIDRGVNLREAEVSYFQLCPSHYFGSSLKEGEAPNPEEEAVELTSEQRETIRDIFRNKSEYMYGKLWYRYDAVIMFGDRIVYKLDFKNKYIFYEWEFLDQRNPELPDPLWGYAELTDEENQILQDMLKGTEK